MAIETFIHSVLARTLVLTSLWLVALTPMRRAAAQDVGRAELERGVHALEDGRLLEAERELRRSLELRPWGFPALKLAETLEGLGRPIEALALYEAISNEEYGAVDPEGHLLVDAGITRAHRAIAHLDIYWNPVAAPVEVRVDGVLMDEVESGTNTLIDANPGDRLVRLRTDSASVESQVRVEPGETLEVRLRFAGAVGLSRVSIQTDPGTHIEVASQEADGELRTQLEAGEYVVTLSNEEGRREQTITVSEQEERYVLDAPRSRRRAWLWVLGGALVLGAAVATTAVLLSGDSAPMIPVDDVGT